MIQDHVVFFFAYLGSLFNKFKIIQAHFLSASNNYSISTTYFILIDNKLSGWNCLYTWLIHEKPNEGAPTKARNIRNIIISITTDIIHGDRRCL